MRHRLTAGSSLAMPSSSLRKCAHRCITLKVARHTYRRLGPMTPLRCLQAPTAVLTSTSTSLWSGSDEFTHINDRLDAPPLPLPALSEPVRVVIVRHGQSTWNAEGRIQGSTNYSELTEKGICQAEKAREMLASMAFNYVFHSPLKRAQQTADIILQGRIPVANSGSTGATGATLSESTNASSHAGSEGLPHFQPPPPQLVTLPSLREIDLYSFQGLLKHEGKHLYGQQYARWQREPHAFEIDGHAPVRELWYRASLAWHSMLEPHTPSSPSSSAASSSSSFSSSPSSSSSSAASPAPRQLLVVAHNAVNQALLATALGLPPPYFRRLAQNNAALSVLDFSPAPDGGSLPEVTLACLNQSPDNPFKNPDKVVAHVVLVTPPPGRAAGGAAAGAPDTSPEECDAAVGDAEEKTEEAAAGGGLRSLAAVLSKLKFTHVLVAPSFSNHTLEQLLPGQPPPTLPQQGHKEPQQGQGAEQEQGQQHQQQEHHAVTVALLDAAEAASPLACWQHALKAVTAPVTDTTVAAKTGTRAAGAGPAEAPSNACRGTTALPPHSNSSSYTTPGAATCSHAAGESYGNVLLILDERAHVGTLWAALGGMHAGAQEAAEAAAVLPPRVRVSPGGLSVLEFSGDPRVTPATVRCINNTAHLKGAA
ncbi:hypothetical protein Agub_g8815 [Astrephomene gubernaculifera]|uniref:Phosphoglycerate mutase n=1 Tax=Astrephomene gubernaculifera TaxID=47775 RepID=A0AAD3DSM0_9CHLO|nr:hypothetical protein Agub_g8815 [Astrephomene gubernaculifera]